MLTNFWPAQRQTARPWGKRRGNQMQEMTLFTLAKAFFGNMPTDISGVLSEESAARPPILAPRHVLPPAMHGSNLPNSAASQSGCPSSADVLAGMDGVLPEYVADMPSTLRWAH